MAGKDKSAKSSEAKKKPASAKPKKEPAKKVAKGKKDSAQSDKDSMSESSLATLKADAERIDREISEQAQALGSEYGKMAAQHANVEDFIERKLWRYTPTPYVSETAWVKGKNHLLGSAAKVFSIVGKYKALKGETTQEQRVKMGARKGSVATADAKQAQKKGKKIPVEIIEKAVDPKVTEPELRQAVIDADLGPDPEPIVSDKCPGLYPADDSLLAKPEGNTLPDKFSKGGSGVVEGQSGTASQFDSAINDAVECASRVYVAPGEPEERDYGKNLRFVCNMWLGQMCEATGHEKQTNAEALTAWRRKHAKGAIA